MRGQALCQVNIGLNSELSVETRRHCAHYCDYFDFKTWKLPLNYYSVIFLISVGVLFVGGRGFKK